MKSSLTLIASCSLAMALAIPAFAGTPLEKSVIIPTSPPTQDWWFLAGIDTWISATDGDVGINGLITSADTSISDALSEIDFAYMGYFEIGYRRWSLGVDVVYARLSDDATFSFGPIDGRLSLEQEQAYVTVRAQYRAVQTDKLALDVFAGFRWMYVDIDTDVHISRSFDRPALQRFNRDSSRRFDLSEDWIDPIIGLRGIYNFNSDWFFQFAGDIGGFGAASELTWQAIVGIGYNFTPHMSVALGYRALGVDYDKPDFKLDTVTYGPIVAFVIRF